MTRKFTVGRLFCTSGEIQDCFYILRNSNQSHPLLQTLLTDPTYSCISVISVIQIIKQDKSFTPTTISLGPVGSQSRYIPHSATLNSSAELVFFLIQKWFCISASPKWINVTFVAFPDSAFIFRSFTEETSCTRTRVRPKPCKRS